MQTNCWPKIVSKMGSDTVKKSPGLLSKSGEFTHEFDSTSSASENSGLMSSVALGKLCQV